MSGVTSVELPRWAEETRQLFRAGATSQFVLYGNVFDVVPAGDARLESSFVSLNEFLAGTMFQPFDVVILYDRGRGVRIKPPDPFRADAYKPIEEVFRFLKGVDAFRGAPAGFDAVAQNWERLDLKDQLPRDPKRALELIDRILSFARRRTIVENGKVVAAPLKAAVILDYAQFIAPQGDPIYVADLSQTLIQIQDWAANPEITGAFIATVLVTENLTDLNRSLVETPYSAKIRIPLPSASEIRAFVEAILPDGAQFEKASEVSRDVLADKLVGLSCVSVRTLLKRALTSRERITGAYLTRMKKELIEKEAAGRLEFLETTRTLDDVAGHVEAKAWLREDAILLRRGRTMAIPMGYLLTGRIGTGKTYLVECLSGEIGIPCVEMKNFREKWVGATEGNLEKVFSILHALGQVIVFVDEADQMTGKRGGGDSDSGLSGRVYGMLAKEMSDTRNRGKIIWIFATSRPDLVEVDLKRQGRLDVHIPLFPPGDAEGRAELFAAMARKLKMPVEPKDLPRLPDNDQIGGNEMEGILVRALRVYETGKDAEERGQGEATSLPACIKAAIADFRPSAHVERLQLMDLLAVKECTDTRFLPERFRKVSLAEINARIESLKTVLGE
ncbi:MAG TPA: AAA family ATPase [Vicinamibacteria bacterium]|nr:AAA family ATPase [Vicinamibacteria bacterium]